MTEPAAAGRPADYRLPNPCFLCGNVVEIPMRSEDWAALWEWKQGEYVQVAFAHWSADRREVLISGAHQHCWSGTFGDLGDEG